MLVVPHNTQAECTVISTALVNPQARVEALAGLKSNDFYLPECRRLFEFIQQRDNQNKEIDAVTAYESGVDTDVVNKILEWTQFNGDINGIIRIVKEKSVLRQLLGVSDRIKNMVFDDCAADELLNQLQDDIYKITSDTAAEYISQSELIHQAWENINDRKSKDGITGVPSGFKDLDRLTAGWQPGHLIFLAAVPKMGKCLGKGTKVLTYDGSLKNVEDVKAGDLLMGADSTPRVVLSTVRGRGQMYWIRQSNGIDFRVNESHILSLKKAKNFKGPATPGDVGDVFNISVHDFINSSIRFQTGYKGYKACVEFPEKEVPIEPYFLGLWLGDGTSGNSCISNMDREIVDYLNNYASRLGFCVKVGAPNNRCHTYRITTKQPIASQYNQNSLQSHLRRLGVLGNKHIPKEYLINSKRNRLALLAGLIDSDGYYLRCHNGTGSGPYEITLSNKRLAKQVKFLCDTLGYRTRFSEKKATIKEVGFESTVYRVRFNGNCDEIPVLLARKKANRWTRNDNWTLSKIQVEKDIVDDYFGFELDGDGLFLLEDMTVTHNSSAGLHFAMHAGVPTLYFSLEMLPLEMADREFAVTAEIDSHKIKSGNLSNEDWERLTGACNDLVKMPISWVDKSFLTVTEIKAIARRHQQEKGLGLVIIDQLDKIRLDRKSGESKVDAIGRVTLGLKNMARDLKIPVIVLCQLLDKQVKGRPEPGDTRDSSYPDQDCDVMIQMWRPEFYYPKKAEFKNLAEFIIVRQRSGPTGSIWVRWEPKYTKFQDLLREFWPKGG